MSKNTGTSELINYFDLGVNGDVGIAGSLDINTIANATTDTDTFLVSDTGIIKYRTGAQLLSDIGAAPATGGSYLPLTGGILTGTTRMDGSGGTVPSITMIYNSGINRLLAPLLRLYGATNEASNYIELFGTLATSNRTINFPDASGTVALTSNIPANPVGGTGTSNFLPKFTGSTTIGNSQIFDNGTNVGINDNNPLAKLQITTAASTSAIRISEGSHDGSGSTFSYTALSYWARQDNVERTGTDPLATSGSTAAIVFTDRPGTSTFNSVVRSSDIQFWTASNFNGSILGQYPTLRATITAEGNFGIGTNSPGNFSGLTFTGPFLDVAGVVQIKGTSANGLAILQFGGDTFRKATIASSIGTEAPYLSFGTASSGSDSSSSERMRIDSNGTMILGGTSTTGTAGTGSGRGNLILAGSTSNKLTFNNNSTTVNGYVYSDGSELQISSGAGYMNFYSGNTERMRITSGGSVLIGTQTNPYNIGSLVVNHNSTFARTYFQRGVELIEIVPSDGTAANFISSSYTASGSAYKPLAFSGRQNPADLYLLTSGNVAIGATTDNGARLRVNGSGWFDGALTMNAYSFASSAIQFTRAASNQAAPASGNGILVFAGGNAQIRMDTSNGINFDVNNGGNPHTPLWIRQTGNTVAINSPDNNLMLELRYQNVASGYLGAISSALYAYSVNGGYALLNSSSAWVPASDIKRKRNFEPYTKGLSAILGLQPKLYNMDFQKDGDEKQVGLVAQEVRDFIPLAYEENADFIGINYNAVIVTMVKAIQEQQQQIQELKNKLS